jgi:hypothetical protein
MAALLPPGVVQFCDADGHPYAGGTLATYTPGTTTPKLTWRDADETAANTNPIVLDAAGRAIVWGSGLYRTVLRDAAGNQIWDQPSSSLVSDALAPVMIAPTIADAMTLLGVTDAIAAAVLIETDRAESAESVEAGLRLAADASLEDQRNADVAAQTAVNAAITAALAAETARAEAAEAALTSGVAGTVQVRTGTVHSDPATGVWTVAFTPAFPNACLTVQGHGMAASPELYYLSLFDTSGFPTLPSPSAATGTAWGFVSGAGMPATSALDLDFAWTATGW